MQNDGLLTDKPTSSSSSTWSSFARRHRRGIVAAAVALTSIIVLALLVMSICPPRGYGAISGMGTVDMSQAGGTRSLHTHYVAWPRLNDMSMSIFDDTRGGYAMGPALSYSSTECSSSFKGCCQSCQAENSNGNEAYNFFVGANPKNKW